MSAQIGRTPRGVWRVVARCAGGAPTAIAVAPLLEGGRPFPTTFWLTCPRLVAAVHDLESAGVHAEWARRIEAETDLASAVLAGDESYRKARAREGGGDDPCGDVGMGGQRDALTVKCLHARVAASLGGVPDPIGAAVSSDLAGVTARCSDERCRIADAGAGAQGSPR